MSTVLMITVKGVIIADMSGGLVRGRQRLGCMLNGWCEGGLGQQKDDGGGGPR